MAKIQHGRDLTPEEMAQILDEFVNANHDDQKREKFADQIVNRTHRTLQQGIMRFFLATIEKWATTPHFDARNESTINLSKKIISTTGDKYDRFLPYI